MAWAEEPTLQYGYAGPARTCEALDVLIQIGENWFGSEEIFKALSAGACVLAMQDIMKMVVLPDGSEQVR